MTAVPAEVLTQLTVIFRNVTENEHAVLAEDTAARDVEGWDSFTHLKFITAIEEHYGIRFALKDVVGFRNVGDMCRAVLAAAR
ncbi:MAG TPA: acyl carrier protein [Steroidobacteraceae bacterium]|nr:acyl carrier protein [Steroidobacteraceae bacterium]